MKRPLALIVGAVAGALVIAGVGASAHSSLRLTHFVGQGSGVFSEEASAPRVETPEPTDTPEVKAPATNTNTQETETETEANDTETETDTETNDDNATKAAAPTTTGEHETGDKKDSGSGGEKGD